MNQALNAWEVDAARSGEFPTEMFRRGRLDHIALAARDEGALEILRRRLVAHGACEGKVSDFGSVVSVWFTDPDGMELEVACIKQGADIADAVDPQPEDAGMSA